MALLLKRYHISFCGASRIYTVLDCTVSSFHSSFCLRNITSYILTIVCSPFHPYFPLGSPSFSPEQPVNKAYVFSSSPLPLAVLWLLAPLNPTVMSWPGTDAVNLFTVNCEWAATICNNNLVLLGPLSFTISPCCSCCLSYAAHFGHWTAAQLAEMTFLLSSGLMWNSLGAWPFSKAADCQVWLCFSGPVSVQETPEWADCDIIWQTPQTLVLLEVFSADLYSLIIPMKIFGPRQNPNEFGLFVEIPRADSCFRSHTPGAIESFLVKCLGHLSDH